MSRAGSGGPRWRRLAPWLAPAALVAIALHQIALAHLVDLSPWKGGGYGMFSTTDRGGARSVRIHALGDGPARRVPVPPHLVNRAYRVRDLPRASALDAFAREIARESPDAVVGARRVRVEVWRTRHDPESLEPRREMLRRREVWLGEGRG